MNSSSTTPTPTPTDNTNGGQGGNTDKQNLPVAALRLLQRADQKFAQANAALKAGDLQGYATAVDEAHRLVQRALVAK